MAKFLSPEDSWKAHRHYPYYIEPTGAWDKRAAGRLNDTLEIISWTKKLHLAGADTPTLLDIGCNSGYLLEEAQARGFAATGVDVAPRMVRYCRLKGLKAYRLAAEKVLDYFGAGSFSTVVLGEVLEHVFDPDEVFRQAVAVATMNVVGSVPTEKSEWGRMGHGGHPHHTRQFTRKSLGELIGRHSTDFVIMEKGEFYIFEAFV